MLNQIFFRHGDWVEFRIATDRRDQLKRATNISLLPESFVVSGERREQGIIAVLKQGFGFLRSVEREPKIYFTFNEVLDVQRKLECNDEVEFTVAQVILFYFKLILEIDVNLLIVFIYNCSKTEAQSSYSC